ncbi:hypothetical protein ABG768_007036, partial [Culter alburnus]
MGGCSVGPVCHRHVRAALLSRGTLRMKCIAVHTSTVIGPTEIRVLILSISEISPCRCCAVDRLLKVARFAQSPSSEEEDWNNKRTDLFSIRQCTGERTLTVRLAKESARGFLPMK